MKICIIAAALPPQLDGIGDYTAQLAATLAKSACVSILTTDCGFAPIPGVDIISCFSLRARRDIRQIAAEVAKIKPDWLLLQYNPFSYGRWGLNLHLSFAIGSALRRSPTTRFALMVHEPFVPWTSWKFVIMSVWQRWQLWLLGRAAKRIFFSIEPWAIRFRTWFEPVPVMHLPVASNIPDLQTPRIEARQRLSIDESTVVVGLFGSLNASRLPGLIQETLQALGRDGRDVTLLYIGPDAAAAKAAFPSIRLIADGAASPEEVSRRFSAMDVYLAPYLDGVSTRRTTLMAGLQHGIPTVGTSGALTDDLLREQDGRAFLLARSGKSQGFKQAVERVVTDEELRRRLCDGSKRLYDGFFTWESLAATLLAELRTNASI